MRRRWIIWATLLPAYFGLLMWLCAFILMVLVVSEEDPDDLGEIVRSFFSPWDWELDEGELWISCGIPAGALVLTQALFLWPIIRIRRPRAGRAKSLRLSMVMAGLVAALLTGGLFAGTVGLIQLLCSDRASNVHPEEVEIVQGEVVVISFSALVFVSWIVWSLILMAFARRRRGTGVLERIVGWLLGGTIAEVLVIVPLDIMIRRRTDCYCATGSFWSLTMSAWAPLWLAGPGIVLAMRSRRRDPWWESHCINCGYSKGPSPGAQCPECGYEWQSQTAEKANSQTR